MAATQGGGSCVVALARHDVSGPQRAASVEGITVASRRRGLESVGEQAVEFVGADVDVWSDQARATIQ